MGLNFLHKEVAEGERTVWLRYLIGSLTERGGRGNPAACPGSVLLRVRMRDCNKNTVTVLYQYQTVSMFRQCIIFTI